MVLAGGEGAVLTGRLSVAAQPWLADHMVLGRVVLPGTALVEMALRAGLEVGCGQVRELVLQAPLVLPETGGVRVQVRVGGPDAAGEREVSVHGQLDADRDEWVLHASGVVTGDTDAAAGFDLSVWPPVDAVGVAVDRLYNGLAAAGYGHGPMFQGVRQVWRDADRVYAEVALPEAGAADIEGFGIHPALFDAALHSAGFLGPKDDGRPRLPFAWTGVRLFATGATVLRVALDRVGDGIRIQAADSTGQPVAAVQALVLRPVSPQQLPATPTSLTGGGDALLTVDWTTLSVAARADAVDTGNAADLSAWLTITELVQAGSGQSPSIGVGAVFADRATARAAIADGLAPPTVIALPIPASPAGSAADGVAERVRQVSGDVLELVQDWLGDDTFAGSRLLVLTRGAVPAGPGGAVRDLAGAAVWGLLRSAQTENPGRIVLGDLDPADLDPADLNPAWRRSLVALVAAGDESALAVRGSGVWAARMVRGGGAGLTVPAGDGSWALTIGGEGSLEGLSLKACGATPALGAGQVRLAVRAAGVNFRDVLIGLGMYPEPASMGSEAAGVVIEVGPEVEDLAVGDRWVRNRSGHRSADVGPDPGRVVVRPGGVGSVGVRYRVLRVAGSGRCVGRGVGADPRGCRRRRHGRRAAGPVVGAGGLRDGQCREVAGAIERGSGRRPCGVVPRSGL
jgi:Polyketide synthase dehydratase/Alcohol dehydrogenase GroES-like domain